MGAGIASATGIDVGLLHDRLTASIERARAIAGSRRASIMLPDNSGELRIASASGLSVETVVKARVRLGEPIAGVVAQTRRPVVRNATRARGATPDRDYLSSSFI